MKQSQNVDPVPWWKDKKLLAGIFLVILSTLLGLYGKGLLGIFFISLFNKIYKPFYLLTGISVYAISWALLFLGIFLVGWETVKIIRDRIRHHIRKTVKGTYHYTKKGYHYTKGLPRKGIDKISKTSREIVEKMRN